MLSPELVAVLGLLLMFAGLFLGVQLAITLGAIGFAGCAMIIGFSKSISLLTTTPYSTVTDYSFIVLPMFILMGELAFQGGIGSLLYSAAVKWLGRLHGGLAMATAVANAFFGAISGSSLAAVATFGKIALPEMLSYKYDSKLACGVICAAGTLASLIPPSGIMILYTIFTQVSLSKLMIAGIVPGLLEALCYMALIYFRVRLNPRLAPRSLEVVPFKEKLLAIRWLTPIAIVIIVMFGGIYAGVFSPIEAGAVGAFTVLVVVLARRSLPMPTLRISLANTLYTSAMIFWVIVGAMIFGKFLVLSGLVDMLQDFVTGLAVPPIVILMVVLFIYVVLGCIMSVIEMLVITLPIFFPLLHGLGFDGVWLGILVVKIVEMAAITPPYGLNIYVLKGVIGDVVSIGGLFRGIFPFFIIDVLNLVLLVIFPQICLWLPSMMYQ